MTVYVKTNRENSEAVDYSYLIILSGRHMLNHVHVAARADYVNFPRAVNMVNYLIDH